VSYDLRLTQDGQSTEIADDEFEWLNITYNLRPMFVRAIGEAGVPDVCNEGIRTIYGLTGAQASDLVHRMLRAINADRVGYSQLDASNGWGTRQDCEAFLSRVIAASDQHPDAIWGGD
jgi:hypothetical protein